MPNVSNLVNTIQDTMRKDDDVRWQWSGATWTTIGSPEGWRGGANQIYTPSCVVRLLVEMLAPYTALRGSAFLQNEASPQVVSAAKDNSRIYDPACGSGGMFVQSEKFVESQGGRLRGGLFSIC